MKRVAVISIFGILGVLYFSLIRCGETQTQFSNHGPDAEYVGLKACAECHADKAQSFVHTGMGSSFDLADSKKSLAVFGPKSLIYDSIYDFYYFPFFKGNDLFIKEFRLEKGDTVFQRTEKINYIIGSGQHTQSNLIYKHGFLFQAPITWYTQAAKWDLAPGFEKGGNQRFSRLVNIECISCHNAMPEVAENSETKFTKIGLGIDCERCHGPGSLHVKSRKEASTHFIKNGKDLSIVNPRKLNWDLQIDVCQRCHLQGNIVLQKGKSVSDFRPGMKLSSVFEVFTPKTEGDQDFDMAMHAARFQMSRCFKQSNTQDIKFNCISCHNPHVSVKITPQEHFNSVCSGCHNTSKNTCTEKESKRTQFQNNCVACHMPESQTKDILHVKVHDHYIRKKPIKIENKGPKNPGDLYCINNPKPSKENLLKAYLSYFEKFDKNNFYLNRAKDFLNEVNSRELNIHYFYLRNDFNQIIEEFKNLKNDFEDPWTPYRVGIALIEKNRKKEGIEQLMLSFYKQPTAFLIAEKIGKTYLEDGMLKESLNWFEKALHIYPDLPDALVYSGYIYLKEGNISEAKIRYEKAIKLNPDHYAGLMNLSQLYALIKNPDREKIYLERAQKSGNKSKSLF